MVKLFQVGQSALGFPGFQLPFQGLQVMVEIMLVSPHFPVDTLDFPKVLSGLFCLICY